MPGICAIRAAAPHRFESDEDWTVWSVLHACGRTERMACPRGSGTPKSTACRDARPGDEEPRSLLRPRKA